MARICVIAGITGIVCFALSFVVSLFYLAAAVLGALIIAHCVFSGGFALCHYGLRVMIQCPECHRHRGELGGSGHDFYFHCPSCGVLGATLVRDWHFRVLERPSDRGS